MKVAIDKNCINKIKDFSEYEYIYIFNDEKLEDLKRLNLHCIHKDFVDEVDINLSSYNVNCVKKADVNDKNWTESLQKKDYKFAIIVPSYNNDHRKL